MLGNQEEPLTTNTGYCIAIYWTKNTIIDIAAMTFQNLNCGVIL